MYSRFIPRIARRQTPSLFTPPRRTFTMSNTAFSNATPAASEPTPTLDANATTKKEQLALPEVPHNPTTQLDMSNGSTTIKLDHLGPMVVNVDGSLGRITNWNEMTEMERKNTLRVVGKRNQVRLAAVRAKEAEEGKE